MANKVTVSQEDLDELTAVFHSVSLGNFCLIKLN